MPEPMSVARLASDHWRERERNGPRCPTCSGIVAVLHERGKDLYGSYGPMMLGDLVAAEDEVSRLQAANAALSDTLQELWDWCGEPLIQDQDRYAAAEAKARDLLRDADAVGARYAAVVSAARLWRAAERERQAAYTPRGDRERIRETSFAAKDALDGLQTAVDALDGGTGEAAGDGA